MNTKLHMSKQILDQYFRWCFVLARLYIGSGVCWQNLYTAHRMKCFQSCRFHTKPKHSHCQHQVQYQHKRLSGCTVRYVKPPPLDIHRLSSHHITFVCLCIFIYIHHKNCARVHVWVSVWVDKVSHESFVHIINFNYSTTKTWLIIRQVEAILHR